MPIERKKKKNLKISSGIQQQRIEHIHNILPKIFLYNIELYVI